MPLETFFTVPQQVWLFLASVLLGGAMGVVFDVFRALRIVFPQLHGSALTAVEDILFWLAYGGAVYVFSLLCGRGQLRGFFFLGSLAGFVIYLVTVGKSSRFCVRQGCKAPFFRFTESNSSKKYTYCIFTKSYTSKSRLKICTKLHKIENLKKRW